MKTSIKSRIKVRSLLSLGVLAAFLIIAVGSATEINYEASTKIKHESLDDGRRKTSYTTGDEDNRETVFVVKTFTGTQDTQGRWVGPLEVEKGNKRDTPEGERYWTNSHERVTMVDGERHGTGFITDKDGNVETVCWDRNKRLDCEKADSKSALSQSAWDILSYEYPWYVDWLNPFGFDDGLIQSYLDSLELFILSQDFSEGSFEDYYQEARNILEQSPTFDSIVQVQSILTLLAGMEESRNKSEFRMAVIDQHRQDQWSTFEMIGNKYPGYLQSVYQLEATEAEFEDFCTAFDSIMYSWNALDQAHLFFVDSVENRMFQALNILSVETDTTEEMTAVKSARRHLHSRNISGILVRKAMDLIENDGLSRADLAGIVSYSFIMYLLQGDKIYESLYKVYRIQESLVVLPVLTTNLESHLSATSVELRGSILDDGGGEITASGIAWSTHYSPTVEDQVLSSNARSGSFWLILDGLTEGQRYYARTFATTSAGTAYGNNAEFTVSASQGLTPPLVQDLDFRIFPNPAHSISTVRFHMEHPDVVSIQIYDMKGSRVATLYHENLPPGDHSIQIKLDGLPASAYQCSLLIGASESRTSTLIISR